LDFHPLISFHRSFSFELSNLLIANAQMLAVHLLVLPAFTRQHIAKKPQKKNVYGNFD